MAVDAQTGNLQDRWQWLAAVLLVVSAAIFYASLQYDSFYIDSLRPHPVPPVALLLFGFWSGSASWFANPLLLFSWLTLLRAETRVYALATSACALLLALWFAVTVGDDILTHEGGGVHKDIAGLGTGYWIWVADIGITCVGSAALVVLSQRTEFPASDDSHFSNPPE